MVAIYFQTKGKHYAETKQMNQTVSKTTNAASIISIECKSPVIYTRKVRVN